MTNVQQRFLLFGVVLPLLVLIILLPYKNHLAMNILIIVTAGAGSYETVRLLQKTGCTVPAAFVVPMAGLLPLLTFLWTNQIVGGEVFPLYILLVGGATLTRSLFTLKEREFKGLVEDLAGAFWGIFYPGFFLSYLVRLLALPQSTVLMIAFILGVYLNDSNAWFCGVFLGKNSKRNIFAVSPNKSLIGFGGGLFASMVIVTSAYFLYPGVLGDNLVLLLLFGLIFGLAVILGDLVESGIKRSVGAKDSGKMIMGRGGLLDSIDSLLLAAPVYYYFVTTFTLGN